MNLKKIYKLITAFSIAFTGSAIANENLWPTKPIKFVVGFAPGGVTDVMARAVAHSISESMKHSVIVENKMGVGGNVSVSEVIKSAPDGYTFLIGPNSIQTTNPFLFKNNLNPEKNLTAIAGIGRNQMYLIVKPDSKFKDARELVEFGRSNKNVLSYASSGSGTPPHLAAELFKNITKISAVHVPYRGSVPALQDILANQVDYVFDPGLAFQHVRTGKVRMLAVASKQRSPFFPDVPSMSDLGFDGAELDAWYGIWAPNGVPSSIIDKITSEVEKALKNPDTKSRYESAGAEAIGLNKVEFNSKLKEETKTLSNLIKLANIVAE